MCQFLSFSQRSAQRKIIDVNINFFEVYIKFCPKKLEKQKAEIEQKAIIQCQKSNEIKTKNRLSVAKVFV